MGKNKWFLAKDYPPPEDRKFLAIFKHNIFGILNWSNMDDCWYTSPIGRDKIYKEDIRFWRQIPKMPPDYLDP